MPTDWHVAAVCAGAYVPPALRAKAAAAGDNGALQRRVKGLLNRLAASNLQGIAAEVAALMQQAGRQAVGELLTDELHQVCICRQTAFVWKFCMLDRSVPRYQSSLGVVGASFQVCLQHCFRIQDKHTGRHWKSTPS